MFFDKFFTEIDSVLLEKQRFYPYPITEDYWRSIPRKVKEEAISEGEKYIGFNWGQLSAIGYAEFFKNGNRTNYENINFSRRIALNCLVVGECVERKGRFLNDIINGIWAICEESSWVLPAHNGGNCLPDINKPFVDLFAGQTAAQLAFCIYLLRQQLDSISENIVKRVEYEITKRVINPCIEFNFWWMGFGKDRRIVPSNWTAWCNATTLAACLLVEENHDKRVKFVKKSMEILDYYISAYPEDGGCDEGANYWEMSAGCMFDALELLYCATNKKVNLYDIQKIKDMGSFISKMHIGGKYFINFADCSIVADKGGARSYLFGKRTGCIQLEAFGAEDYWQRDDKTLSTTMNMQHKLIYISMAEEILNLKLDNKNENNNKSVYIESLQLLYAKKDDFAIAVKGGHNADNHNHNDVGSFMVYYKQKPFIIDVGVESYTKKTFSNERYTIWTMQSAYHNLPTVNGIMQKDGRDFCAKNVVHDEFSLSCDIAGAYPKEAKIKTWNRKTELLDEAVSIVDDFSLYEISDDIKCSIMVWQRPELEGNSIGIDDAVIQYDDAMWKAIVEKISIPYDAKLTPVWGECVYRIVFSIRQKCNSGKFEIKVRRKN